MIERFILWLTLDLQIVGEFAFWAALALAAWGVLAALLSASGETGRARRFAESSARALSATALLSWLAVAGLAKALLASDLGLAFVAGTTTRNLPVAFRFLALLSRPAGALLVLTAFVAAFGAIALRRAHRASEPPAPVLSTLLTGAVLSLLVVAATAGPYAHMATEPADGTGLDSAWQVAAVPLARLLLLVAAALALVALARMLAGAPSRRWAFAAWGAGSVALLAALRRSLAGPPWGLLEWIALAVWLASAVVEYRRAGAPREVRALVLVGAGAAVLALAGTALRVDQRLPLASSESREVAGPLGSRWRITSEGLSSYEELNRLVSAVLVDVRRGRGRTRLARVEWRQYLDTRGDIIAQDIPVAGVVNGALNTVVIRLAEEPRLDGAIFDLRIIPLFGLWWVAAACFVAAAAAGLRSSEEGAA